MVRRLTATEVEANLFALLDEVTQGEVVEITSGGVVITRIVRAQALKGMFEGVVRDAVPPEELYSTGSTWTFDEENLKEVGC